MKTPRVLQVLLALTLALAEAAPTYAQADPWTLMKVTEIRGNSALGQTIVVKVDKLSEWAALAGNEPAKLVLFLNGRPLTDLTPKAVDRSRNELQFDIRHTAATRDTWAQLLGRPDGFQRDMLLSVGTDKGVAIAGAPVMVRFLLVDKVWFWIFVGVLVVAGGLFLWLARSSNILRDSGQEPTGARRTYSLARTQMAIWFFLIVASYVLIWLLTGTGDSVTATVLGLMGISAGTALGAAVVDANRPAQDGGAKVGDPNRSASSSKGFLKDIVNGPEGVSLHRFQMLIWTVVLGIIFIASVYNGLAMPEFSATLLGLMGISSGTYLGFKIPEKG